MPFDEIVSDYIQEYRSRARGSLADCKDQLTLAGAISNAVRPGGQKHDHQYRIPPSLFDEAQRRLQGVQVELKRARDFDSVHETVEHTIGSMRGIGPLTVYDIAHRIGAFLEKEPTLVYLHRGTKDGAAILGLKGKTLDPRKLPPALRRLTAAEIEDCLCIYKEHLAEGEAPTSLRETNEGCVSTKPRATQTCPRMARIRRRVRC